MAEPAVVEPPAELDPFAKDLIESIGKVLPPGRNGDDIPLRPIVTLGESVAAHKAGSTEPGKALVTPPAKTQAELDAEKAIADKAAADAKLAAEKANPQVKQTPPRLRKKTELLTPTAKVVTQLQTAPAAIPGDDEANLTPEEQEQLSIASYAEAKGRKGIVEETKRFFKAVDKYAEEHPEADPEGEEFTKFLSDNRPKWSEAERRKAERGWVAQQAAEEARRTIDPVLQEQSAQLRRIQAKPLIDDAVSTVDEIMISTKEGGEAQPVEKAVLDAINEKGYEEAVKQFKVEAPIVEGARQAVKAWMEISQGGVQVDVANPTHAWLVSFINEEGQNMLRQPKEVQTARDGRTFVPMNEYIANTRTDPAYAKKHYTFDDQMIVDMIANRAILSINNELNALKASGFVRETKKVSGSPGTQAQTQTRVEDTKTTGSPRAGGTALPGAADPAEQLEVNERTQFFEQLVPGVVKDLGLH